MKLETALALTDKEFDVQPQLKELVNSHLQNVLNQPDRIGREAARTPAITRQNVAMVSDTPAVFDHAQPQIEVFATANLFIKEPGPHDGIAPARIVVQGDDVQPLAALVTAWRYT